ncbi:MAG TPA: hypothetical protein PK239_12310 [Chitinophagales bacterium]|nr:hypothetical protein [Chitinophagales bacterium]
MLLKKNLLFLIALVIIGFLSACDDNNEPDYNLTFKVKPLVNGQPFQLNQAYLSPQNQRFMYEKFTFYLSHVTLVAPDGTEQPVSEVMWYDLSNPETVKLKVPDGNYTTLKFSIGLDSIMNASDPATFAEGHPLSYSQNNYWSWATKYIFAKLEGRCDNNPNSAEWETAFLYHLGLDTLYRQTSVARTVSLTQDNLTNIELTLNVEEIFNNLDIVANKTTHSTNNLPLAIQVTDNFLAAFE